MTDPTFVRHLALLLDDDDDALHFRIVFVLGEARTLGYLARAASILQHGGMWTPDRTRRYTWKELLCEIIKACATNNEQHAIFSHKVKETER